VTAPVTIWLPGPPRGKGRPRHTKTGRTYTDSATRAYEAALQYVGRRAMAGREPLQGPLAVDLVALFTPPVSWSKRKLAQAHAGELRPMGSVSDIDNLAKSIDGLNGVVWIDDAQVVDLSASKRYSAVAGLHITVRPAAPAPPLVSP